MFPLGAPDLNLALADRFAAASPEVPEKGYLYMLDPKTAVEQGRNRGGLPT